MESTSDHCVIKEHLRSCVWGGWEAGLLDTGESMGIPIPEGAGGGWDTTTAQWEHKLWILTTRAIDTEESSRRKVEERRNTLPWAFFLFPSDFPLCQTLTEASSWNTQVRLSTFLNLPGTKQDKIGWTRWAHEWPGVRLYSMAISWKLFSVINI